MRINGDDPGCEIEQGYDAESWLGLRTQLVTHVVCVCVCEVGYNACVLVGRYMCYA